MYLSGCRLSALHTASGTCALALTHESDFTWGRAWMCGKGVPIPFPVPCSALRAWLMRQSPWGGEFLNKDSLTPVSP